MRARARAGGMVEYRRSLAASFLFRFFVDVALRLEASEPSFTLPLPASFASAAGRFARPPARGLQYYARAGQDAVVGAPHRHLAADIQARAPRRGPRGRRRRRAGWCRRQRWRGLRRLAAGRAARQTGPCRLLSAQASKAMLWLTRRNGAWPRVFARCAAQDPGGVLVVLVLPSTGPCVSCLMLGWRAAGAGGLDGCGAGDGRDRARGCPAAQQVVGKV